MFSDDEMNGKKEKAELCRFRKRSRRAQSESVMKQLSAQSASAALNVLPEAPTEQSRDTRLCALVRW